MRQTCKNFMINVAEYSHNLLDIDLILQKLDVELVYFVPGMYV